MNSITRPNLSFLIPLLIGFGFSSLAHGAGDSTPPPLAAHGDFEGGSAVIESIDQAARLIRLHPKNPRGHRWAYWWYARITGIEPGEVISLDVGGRHGRFAHPERAAFSTDQRVWLRTPPGERRGERIVYRQKIDAEEAWFAWGPPFLPSDASRLVQRLADQNPDAEAFELCKTRHGRPVPALRVSPAGDGNEPRFGLWIQARQHAWECGSSWVARGFAEWLLGGDARARSLRKRTDITIVPIMDVDSVAIGAGGKEQMPHDHNRDWTGKPYWPAVGAAMDRIRRLDGESGLDLFIDLHDPGMYAPESYYLTSPRRLDSRIGRRNLRRFIKVSLAEITGPMKLTESSKAAGPEYTGKWRDMSQNWIKANMADHVVALTLETAWNHPDADAAGYMNVGRQMGLAIERYLRLSPRRPLAANQPPKKTSGP